MVTVQGRPAQEVADFLDISVNSVYVAKTRCIATLQRVMKKLESKLAMKHYTKEELELYRNKEMSVLGRINCAMHLRECPDCAKLLKELEKEDAFVTELRNSFQLFDEVSRGCCETRDN